MIELGGNVGARLLRPLADDFGILRSEKGVTLLVGEISDAAHLHGIVVHLTSMNIDIISIVRSPNQDEPSSQPPTTSL